MSLPTMEQNLRLHELIRDGKLTDVGFQEMIDRYKELEFVGLYKKTVQAMRALYPEAAKFCHFFESWAEFACLTMDDEDCGAAFLEARAEMWDGREAELAKVRALLMLAQYFQRRRAEAFVVMRRIARRLAEHGELQGAFDAWFMIFEESDDAADETAMNDAAHAIAEAGDRALAFGRCATLWAGDISGQWRSQALETLASIENQFERFTVACRVAALLKDDACFQAVSQVMCLKQMSGLARFNVRERQYMDAHFIWLQLVYGQEKPADIVGTFHEWVKDAEQYSWYAPIVKKIVGLLSEREETDAVEKFIKGIPDRVVLQMAKRRRFEYFLEISASLAGQYWADNLAAEDVTEDMEFRYLLAMAKELEEACHRSEALKPAVERLSDGYLHGLVSVAEVTGDSRDAVCAYDAIPRTWNAASKLQLLLPLLKVVRNRLVELKKD